MELREYSTKREMSLAAAEFAERIISEGSGREGLFNLALSGGSSPSEFYGILSVRNLEWERVRLFLVDERMVPSDHPESNTGMIRKVFLSSAGIRKENIIFPDTSAGDHRLCAEMYDRAIADILGPDGTLDLVVLGIGPDGHTASIFPGQEVLPDGDRFAVPSFAPGEFAVRERITMTQALINRAKNRIFIAAGKGKRDIVGRVSAGDISLPAGRISNESVVFSDTALQLS